VRILEIDNPSLPEWYREPRLTLLSESTGQYSHAQSGKEELLKALQNNKDLLTVVHSIEEKVGELFAVQGNAIADTQEYHSLYDRPSSKIGGLSSQQSSVS
jgi:hypothetical protein